MCILPGVRQIRNISNPTMRTGLDFESAQFDQVRIGGFEMTSHRNKSLLTLNGDELILI